MTMNDKEWQSMHQLWRTADAGVDAQPLRRAVSAHRRWLVIATLGEVLFAAALMWLTWVVLREGVTGWRIIWAISVWFFAAVAYAFVWWNRRGTWRAAGNSVSDFVRLTRLRARRQRLSLRFALGLAVAESVVVVAQLLWFDRFTLLSATLLGTILFIVVIWYAVTRRRIAHDLALASEYDEV